MCACCVLCVCACDNLLRNTLSDDDNERDFVFNGVNGCCHCEGGGNIDDGRVGLDGFLGFPH